MGCLVLACRESASSDASDGATRAGDEASDADSDAMAGPSGKEAAGDEASDTDSDAMAGPSGKEGARFVHCLRRMKTGTNTSADLRLLQGRTECKLGSIEHRKAADEHEECVHLFSTNREVNKHNLKAVKLHGGDDFTTNPVCSCAAVNTNLAVKALDTQTAGGTPNVFVCRGEPK